MASLGEFEQGVPIIEEVKKLYPHHKIVISFFSPSGFRVKKNTPLANAVVYLPIDTAKNSRQFIKEIHPDIAIFIKYEFWPNYLRELKKKNIPAILVSGVFRKDQLFFKSYGKWMRRSLQTFDHFFVQNPASKKLLESIGIQNVTVSGDTRFDRVAKQLQENNSLTFVEEFLGDKICVVAGSTWPGDEELLLEYINKKVGKVKFILAPHQINKENIEKLRRKLKPKVILFSEKDNKNLAEYDVLIIDTIGLLSRIYNYAHIAFVGGAAGNTGLHNILEAATFGIPVITGNNIGKFPEALQLRKLAGLYTVEDKAELDEVLTKMIDDRNFREKTGMIAGHFVQSNTGAAGKIIQYLKNRYVKIP